MNKQEFDRKERQKKVRQLRVRGEKIKDIADYLNVTERTIYKDLSELREEARKRAASAEHWEELGLGLDRYDDIYEMAMFDCHQAGGQNARAKFQKIALEANDKKLDLLLNCGVIARAPTTSINVDVPIAELSTQELKKKKLRIIREIIDALPHEEQEKVLIEYGLHGEEIKSISALEAEPSPPSET